MGITPLFGRVLLDALPTVLEVLAERLELDGIPPDSHAQTETTSGQDVHSRRLLRHEGGLPLGKNQDTRDQFHLAGGRSQEPEQDKGLVERVPIGVRAFPSAGPFWIGAQHMVEHQDVRVPHGLHGLGVVADRPRVLPDLDLWKDNADIHGPPPRDCYRRIARDLSV